MRFGIFVFMLACSAQTKTTIEDNVSDSLADEDGDGYFNDEDCDDLDAQINPGAVELCDAIDNNCDGQVDEGVLSTFFQDSDGDGFGDSDVTEESCQPADGFVAVGTDCDDDDVSSFPGSVEVCDEKDNDCDDVIDNGVGEVWFTDEDGDGYGDQAQESCGGADGLVSQGGDCDDLNPEVYPDAVEQCDGIDNDCDEVIDEEGESIYYADIDGDGFGNPQEQYSLCAPEEGMVEQAGDCDDLDTNINPDALEFCDYIDNNCDGVVDEDTAQDAQEFAVDADGDGYGHPTQTQVSCFLDAGLSLESTDCDDTNAAISPASQEECDGIDNNCDGVIDEPSSIDVFSWYEDSDGDGFGNASVVTLACSVPSGSVADNTDCDDTSNSTFPGAVEVCDEVDNDCDQLIDSDDPNVFGEGTWYIDIDEDGYGSSGFDVVSCFPPSGYVASDTDCNNTDATIFPGAVELCNSVDDDCDGTVDEPDAQDASEWYLDADGDEFGDPTISQIACDEPSSYTDNDLDCDDDNTNINPDASEIYDLSDNDCDGQIDEDLWLGSGSDGDLNITTPTEFSTHVQPNRSYPEAVSYTVDSISSQGLLLSEDALGIAQGDEVLVINLQGTSAAYSNVGTYEFLRVDSVNGSSISFVTPVVETYGETSNGNISSQKLIVQRVPQYQDVDISSVLSTEEFDGTAGGLIVFRATGAVDISSGGRITVDGAGYRGGATGATYNCDAFQGESYAGLGAGQGNGSCNAYNESTGQWAPNFGGGGSHICGGGGNYGGGATGSISWNGSSATAAQAGTSYGVSDLSLLFFGSGGGGVWNGSPGNPGPGGDGGGIIYIGALSIASVDASSISSQGSSTPHWAIGAYTYGAGGGAGGSIYLEALTMSLSSSAIDISGGLGYTSVIRPGGHGGQGRAVY